MTLNELILKLPPGWRIELVNDNNQLGAFTGNAPEGIHVFRFTLTDTQLRSTEHSITPEMLKQCEESIVYLLIEEIFNEHKLKTKNHG